MTSSLTLLLLSWTLLFARASDISLPNAVITKIAFGSCHKNKWARMTQPNIWPSIASLQPDVFVWTGDTVYPPTRGVAPLSLLEAEYQEMLSSPGYSSFSTLHGIYGTWDDHDFGANDGGKENPSKEERRDLFFNFLGYHPPKSRQGVYHSVVFGEPPTQVKLILLDTRWHRDSHCIPSAASRVPLGAGIACLTRWFTAGLCTSGDVLGEEQWEWLQREIQTSTAQINIVVSSIQVLTTNPVMESWGHFPAQRQRLLQMLNGVLGGVLWSGDVHHAELLRAKDNLVEVTSSGLTHTCQKPFYGRVLCEPLLKAFPKHRANASDFYVGRNFGLLQVDWETQQWSVQVHDENATVVLSTGWRAMEPLVIDVTALSNLDGRTPRTIVLLMLSALVVAMLVARRRKQKAKSRQNKAKLS